MMHAYYRAIVLAFTLIGAAFAQGSAQTMPQQSANPTANTAQPADIASVLSRQLGNAERNFTSLAEAMPENKFSFVPTQGEFKGVRTFQQQVTHVAVSNYAFGGMILGEKPPVEEGPDENGPAVNSKADALKLLKDSFDYMRKAIATVNSSNATEAVSFGQGKGTRLGVAILTVAHVNDHYGQCVVYGRMNGTVPPASRR